MKAYILAGLLVLGGACWAQEGAVEAASASSAVQIGKAKFVAVTEQVDFAKSTVKLPPGHGLHLVVGEVYAVAGYADGEVILKLGEDRVFVSPSVVAPVPKEKEAEAAMAYAAMLREWRGQVAEAEAGPVISAPTLPEGDVRLYAALKAEDKGVISEDELTLLRSAGFRPAVSGSYRQRDIPEYQERRQRFISGMEQAMGRPDGGVFWSQWKSEESKLRQAKATAVEQADALKEIADEVGAVRRAVEQQTDQQNARRGVTTIRY